MNIGHGIGDAAVAELEEPAAVGDVKRFSARDVTNFIAKECDTTIEQLQPTMALHGDTVEDRIIIDAGKLAEELVSGRNLAIGRLEKELESSRQVWSGLVLAGVLGVAIAAFKAGSSYAIPLGMFAILMTGLLRAMLGISGTSTLIGTYRKETIADAYREFRAVSDNAPCRPDVVLLGRSGLLYKTPKGVPRYVEYPRLTAIVQQSPDVVSVVIDDFDAIHIQAGVPAQSALKRVLEKVVKAKRNPAGEVSA